MSASYDLDHYPACRGIIRIVATKNTQFKEGRNICSLCYTSAAIRAAHWCILKYLHVLHMAFMLYMCYVQLFNDGLFWTRLEQRTNRSFNEAFDTIVQLDHDDADELTMMAMRNC